MNNCVLIVKHVITFEKGSYGPQYQRAFPRKLAQRHFKKVEGDSTKNQFHEKGNQKRTWNTKIKKNYSFNLYFLSFNIFKTRKKII